MDSNNNGTEENRNSPQPDSGHPQDPGSSRREALIKMGKFAAYTAPALAILLTAEKSEACKCNAGTNQCVPGGTGPCTASAVCPTC